MLAENIGKDQSGKEIADLLCNMSHEKLLEVVQNCPASMLQQFVPNVSAASSSGVACPDSGAGTRPKRHTVLKFPFWAVMMVPGQQRLTVFFVSSAHIQFNRCCGRYRYGAVWCLCCFVLLEPERGVFCLSRKRFSCLCLVPLPLAWMVVLT